MIEMSKRAFEAHTTVLNKTFINVFSRQEPLRDTGGRSLAMSPAVTVRCAWEEAAFSSAIFVHANSILAAS